MAAIFYEIVSGCIFILGVRIKLQFVNMKRKIC